MSRGPARSLLTLLYNGRLALDIHRVGLALGVIKEGADYPRRPRGHKLLTDLQVVTSTTRLNRGEADGHEQRCAPEPVAVVDGDT